MLKIQKLISTNFKLDVLKEEFRYSKKDHLIRKYLKILKKKIISTKHL